MKIILKKKSIELLLAILVVVFSANLVNAVTASGNGYSLTLGTLGSAGGDATGGGYVMDFSLSAIPAYHLGNKGFMMLIINEPKVMLYMGENINIRNLGHIGFEQTNHEYTALRTVILNLNYSKVFSTYCRYKNEGESYTPWQTCVKTKYWLLSEGDGLKTVFYQVNHTYGDVRTYNDTIYLNYTGAGLDTTPPSYVVINDGDFSNVNTSYYASWTASYDKESEILNIPIYYEYSIYVNDVFIRSGITYLTHFNETGFNFGHNDNVSVNVSAVNSAGLKATTKSDGLIIDLEPPEDVLVISSHPEGVWSSISTVSFNWSSSDSLSGIGAYSYVLSKTGEKPNNIPDGVPGNFENEISRTYLNVADGVYYFKIKARDRAGNWGNTTSYIIKIDSTPPRRPNFLSEFFNSTDRSIIYSYTESTSASGIYIYEISIRNNINNVTVNYTTNKTYFKLNNTEHMNYYFRVRARSVAGMWRVWSDEREIISYIAAPGLWAKPQGTVTSQYPIFVTRTSKKAVCMYRNSSLEAFTEFLYTNSTYHEARVRSDGGTYNITCIDMYGNVNSTLITFEFLNDVVSNEPNISVDGAYVGEKVNISVSTQEGYGEIAKSRFDVYLNNERIDYFSLVDEGRGNYSIALRMPVSSGTYSLDVSIDSVSASKSIDVHDLNLIIRYNGTDLDPKKTSRIVYSEGDDYTIGLATEAMIAEQDFDSGFIKIESYAKDNNFIIMTGRIDNVYSRNNYLESRKLFDLQTPSFGYNPERENEIRIILSYPGYVIVGDEKMSRGKHSLLIKSIRPIVGNKRTILASTNIAETSDLSIYFYDD